MATEPWNVLAFEPAHLPELSDLWIESLALDRPGSDPGAERPRFVERIVAMHEAGRELLLAFETATGTLAGCLALELRVGRIDLLVVHPAYRRRAAASALLARARALPLERLEAIVPREETVLSRFLRRQGFVEEVARSGSSDTGHPQLLVWRSRK